MNFPQPLQFSKSPSVLLASTNYRRVFEAMKRGEAFCVEGTYGTAMAFYSWLRKQINSTYPISSYESSRVNRHKWKELSSLFLARVLNGKVNLANAPTIEFLSHFYPNSSDFYLPFSELLGMNGAWQWFSKGTTFPLLSHGVHPYYGVYFPTRTEHLELFDRWLAAREPFGQTMDLGTGCGVLTFYMLKHGVKGVIATDINPNALHSIRLDLEKLGKTQQVILKETSFFQGIDTQSINLVVFNPPWIPDSPFNTLDLAMYYQANFFEEFFSSAYNCLPSSCTLLIIYSNFAQVAGASPQHPIEMELNRYNRFKLSSKTETEINQKPSHRKSWLSDIRQHERVELWELHRVD